MEKEKVYIMVTKKIPMLQPCKPLSLMSAQLLKALIGDNMEQLQKSKTKDNVVHVGLLVPLEVLKDLGHLLEIP